jgi:hypothetical protein
MYNVTNIRQEFEKNNPIIYRYSFDAQKWEQFELMQEVTFEMPDNGNLTIEKGFKWDLSSVPSVFWSILKPFGKYDAAYLIHDKLYQFKGLNRFNRKQCDQIMRDYALALVDTKKASLRRVDVWARYYAVRSFGWIVWNKKD